MDKDKNKDNKATMHEVTRDKKSLIIMFIILAALVAASIAAYFTFVYFIRPGESGTVSFNAPETKPGDGASEKEGEVKENLNVKKDYSGYFVVSEISAKLAVPDDEEDSYKELKIDTGPGGKDFVIEGKIDAGSEIIFHITINKDVNFKTGNFKAAVVLPEVFEKIKLIEDKSGITYDPFSKKIILANEPLNANEEINLVFASVVSKECEDGQSFKLSVNIYADDMLVLESGFSGIINAVADFKNSAMTVKDTNGGSLWAEETIEYEVKIVNSGKGTGSNLVLKCPVPLSTGLVQGSLKPQYYDLTPDKSFIEWNIGKIKPGQVRIFSYRVFTADYLTYKTSIKAGFSIIEKSTGKTIHKVEGPEIFTEQYSYQTIVCMGDSQIIVTEWPLLLDGLLEGQYLHAEFNTVLSGVRGEMATNAIGRFDTDVRPYNPDIIILGYGSNDAGEAPAFFRYHMGILIQQALSTGARVFVHGIGYIDLTNHLWAEKANYTLFDEMLKEEICPKYGVEYIDIYQLFQEDPDKYMSKDGIHWNEEGAALVAHEVFKKIVENLDINGRIKTTDDSQ